MAYPSIISSISNPQATDRLNSPSHSGIERNQNSAIGEIQTFVGTESSAVGTLMYDIRATASDGGGHVQSAAKGGTGQVSFAKGDLLVAQNTTTLSKLTVGSDGLALVADSAQASGVKWGGFPKPTVRVYSTASILTWIKPSNLSYIIVEVQGAGGDGAAGNDGGNLGGAGGGAGGYSKKVIPASLLGATETIIVGSVTGYSSFGVPSYLVATGGASAVNQTGGLGGVSSGGDINTGGADGGAIGTNETAGAEGGTAFYGGGGRGGINNGGAGQPGRAYGGGGGGGEEGGGSGGAAAGGVVIVYEY